jgi:putative ABC transport system ATP-binding protein
VGTVTIAVPIADAISLSHLGYSYPGDQSPVLNIPAWRVERNEYVFLQGESGSGKSTLLSLLAGLSVPTQGSLQILGDDIAKLSTRQRDRFRAANLGVVFQQFNLIPYLSALDNILLAARFGSATTAGARQRATTLLERMNLQSALHHRPASQMSIGQQQRVAIVRALINTPSLLLVDEPTSALDHANRDAFLALLFDVLSDQECAMVFVSHDPALGASFDTQVKISELNHVGATF